MTRLQSTPTRTSSALAPRLDPLKEGAEFFLGPRESKMMEILWDRFDPDPRSSRHLSVIQLVTALDDGLAPPTVLSTLYRLEQKGLVIKSFGRRDEDSSRKVILFRATSSRDEVFSRMVRQTLDSIAANFPDELDEFLERRSR